MVIGIAVGHGAEAGSSHRSKKPEQVSNICQDSPQWFRDGVEAALLAPTGMNRQGFRFCLEGDRVRAEAGRGRLGRIDLGIAKLHFEIGSGRDGSVWLERAAARLLALVTTRCRKDMGMARLAFQKNR